MISHNTVLKELELEILSDADYFCSVEFQRKIGNSSLWEKEYKFEMILFLLQVFSISKDSQHLLMADLLVEQTYNEYLSLTNNMGFINGGAGIINLYVKFYEITSNEKYLHKSLEIINEFSNYFLESDQVDESLYMGRAGLLLNIFYVFHLSEDPSLLRLINLLSRKIISNAVQIQGGLAWYNPFELVIQPPCSFGYGASGIGYVFNVLGKYFNHEPFKEIAKRAFSYVNEQCLDKHFNLWSDYRKNIITEDDLSLHREKFLKGDTSFFEIPGITHSVGHGTAGIVYSQLGDKDNAVQDMIKGIPKELLCSEEDFIGLANLNLELFKRKGHQQYFEEAKALALKLNYKKEDKGYLPLATLKLSLLKGEPCSFQMPKFNNNGAVSATTLNQLLLSNSDIFNLLPAKTYKRTIGFLKTNNLVDFESDVKMAWIHPESFLKNEIESIKVGSQFSKFIKEIFQYEKELNDVKLKQRFCPYSHIKQVIALEDRINSLQIQEHELEIRKLKISETSIVREVNTEASKQQTNIILTFWKYDLEKGVIEVNLNPIKFLLDLFKNGKCIKVALQEVMYYCNLLDDEAIIPLIEYSNSKNRKDLIRRLPFVFRYQVKILIVDGILKWA